MEVRGGEVTCLDSRGGRYSPESEQCLHLTRGSPDTETQAGFLWASPLPPLKARFQPRPWPCQEPVLPGPLGMCSLR